MFKQPQVWTLIKHHENEGNHHVKSTEESSQSNQNKNIKAQVQFIKPQPQLKWFYFDYV